MDASILKVLHMSQELRKQVMSLFVDKMFSAAWDPNHGGIFTFLDVDGLNPTELTWNMKLWSVFITISFQNTLTALFYSM